MTRTARQKRLRIEARARTDCPQPRKARFTNELAAKLAIARIETNGQERDAIPQRAYHCPCGVWHLTKRKEK